MERVRVEAECLLDKRMVPLESAVKLEISGMLSSPAWCLSGTFAVDRFPGTLGKVVAWKGEEALFTGRVDSQKSVLSKDGKVLHLDARTKGALLLDNEANPCVLTNVGLRSVFSLFCEPYGFVCYNPQPLRTLAQYTVRGGWSEWEALTGYTRRVFGLTPYVQGEQICISRPLSASVVRLSNTGKGLPFSRLEHSFVPYHVVSDVLMRDGVGNYSASVHNSSSAYYGVRRKRYVIPQNEFVDALSLDANQRIRRSMLDMEEVVVTMPGFVSLLPGQAVEVADREMELYNLLVREIRWQWDNSGLVTKLWLSSTVYWD